jgi:uncharacterized protein YecT (DUF1311 family)
MHKKPSVLSKLAAAVAFGSFALFANAQTSEQPAMQECSAAAKAGSLSGEARRSFMRECIPSSRARFDAHKAELAESEAKLDSSYDAATRHLREKEAAAAEARLAFSQERWKEFRQAHCAFEEARQNTVNQIDEPRRLRCLVKQTNLRAMYLAELQ